MAIERWVALANDPNAIQEFDLLRASDGRQELTLYLRNLTVIVEDFVADVQYNTLYGIFAVMISNMVAILFISWM